MNEELETITKKQFDEMFKDSIIDKEETLRANGKEYVNMLEFRAQYRIDYKTHRIIHLFNGTTISYELGAKRNVGFQYKTKQSTDKI